MFGKKISPFYTSENPINKKIVISLIMGWRIDGARDQEIFVQPSMMENSLRLAFLYLKIFYIGSKSIPAILQTIPSLPRMVVVFLQFLFLTK